MVEALWQDGEQQADKVDQANAGFAEAAVRRFDQAIDAARELCADSKEVRDRVVEMGRVKMLLTGGGKDQKKDADAKLDLANDLQYQGAFDEAIELYFQAVELYTQVSGHDCPQVAAIHVNIGAVYQRQGRYEEALVELKKGLDVLVAVHSQEHPSVAASFNNIGVVYWKKGDLENALLQYRDPNTSV